MKNHASNEGQLKKGQMKHLMRIQKKKEEQFKAKKMKVLVSVDGLVDGLAHLSAGESYHVIP